jgi:hypothetical protein
MESQNITKASISPGGNHASLIFVHAGIWVTDNAYAAIYGLNPRTLRNWRVQDRKAGRTCARPGFPIYKRFGGSVRYLVEKAEGANDSENQAA